MGVLFNVVKVYYQYSAGSYCISETDRLPLTTMSFTSNSSAGKTQRTEDTVKTEKGFHTWTGGILLE